MDKRPCVRIESVEHALWVNKVLSVEFGVRKMNEVNLAGVMSTALRRTNTYLTVRDGKVMWGRWSEGSYPEGRYWYDLSPTLDNV